MLILSPSEIDDREEEEGLEEAAIYPRHADASWSQDKRDTRAGDILQVTKATSKKRILELPMDCA